jgi:orotate phosphoribosyltransferase-like protein
MFQTAAGFNERFRVAFQAIGLTTDAEIAQALRISIPTARVLMTRSQIQMNVIMAFRIKDLTGYRVNWLVFGGKETPTDPEETRLLQILRSLPQEKRDAVYDRILDVIHE